MNPKELAKYGQRLHSTFPLLGKMHRRKACRKLAEDSSPEAVPYLAEALRSPDEQVREVATTALRSLQERSSIDALCEVAISDPSRPAMSIVKEMDYQPQSVSRRCLLFLLAGQTERYLDLDFEFQHLRAEYQAAAEGLKQRIGEVVRTSGDVRLVGLFREVRRRKLARDLSIREAEIVIEVHARNRQWPEIFGLLFHIPLHSVIIALDALAASGWRPETELEAALLDELLAVRQGTGQLPAAPPPPEVALGPVMQAWVEEGRSPAWTGKAEDKLRGTFIQDPPPEAIRALAALTVSGKTTAVDVESARTHRHWPVRLACLALCEMAPQFAFSEQPIGGEGGGMWIDRLAPALLDAATYQRRAVNLNPTQLEALQSVVNKPGNPGDSRLICGQLLEVMARHHLRHTILVDEGLTVEISETAIEIEG